MSSSFKWCKILKKSKMRLVTGFEQMGHTHIYIYVYIYICVFACMYFYYVMFTCIYACANTFLECAVLFLSFDASIIALCFNAVRVIFCLSQVAYFSQ